MSPAYALASAGKNVVNVSDPHTASQRLPRMAFGSRFFKNMGCSGYSKCYDRTKHHSLITILFAVL